VTIRNNKIDEQVRELEYYCSHNIESDLLYFGESFLHGFYGRSWQYQIDINRSAMIDPKLMKQNCHFAKKYVCGLSFGYIKILSIRFIIIC